MKNGFKFGDKITFGDKVTWKGEKAIFIKFCAGEIPYTHLPYSCFITIQGESHTTLVADVKELKKGWHK